jgi:hypothetical protein
MPLNDALRTATLEDLKKLDLLTLNTSYAKANHEVLNFLYERGIIDDSSIEAALEPAVFNQARRDYEYMTKVKAYTVYADHVGMPTCLAYALDKGKFTRKEIRKMHFDHGDTAKTFPEQYSIGMLLSSLREELLNPTPPIRFNLEEVSECHCSM